MNYLDIRCPSGHLEKVPISGNDPLVKALELVCSRRNLDSKQCSLLYRKKSIDLSLPFRYSGLLNHANVELVVSEVLSEDEVTDSLSEKQVRVCISLESGHRVESTCSVGTCLWTMLESLSVSDKQILDAMQTNLDDGLEPAIVYLRQQIRGRSLLQSSTLSSLGIRDGSVLLQLVRKVPAENSHDSLLSSSSTACDHKVVSANKKTNSTTKGFSEPLSHPASMANNPPASSNFGSTSSQILSQTDIPMADYPFSVFSERPSRSMFDKEDAIVVKKGKSSTVGELIGISLEPDEDIESRNRIPENLVNFKFPEESAGRDLYKTDSSSVVNAYPTCDICDRETVAFRPKSSLSATSSSSEEIPDEFFQLTESELRLIIAALRQEAGEHSFGSQNIRQVAKQRFYSRYQRCIIKFVWPDDFVIQACFLPNEPVSSLYDFLRPYIADDCKDFTLFTTPPKFNLSLVTITLIEANLVPMSRIYVNTACGSSKATDVLRSDLIPGLMRESPESANIIAGNWISKRPTS